MDSSDVLEINRLLIIKMEELASRQEEYASLGQMEKVIEFYGKRERIRREIDSNNKPFVDTKKGSIGNSSGKSDSVNREIADVMKAIQETDQRLEKIISEKKEDLISDIKQIRKGQKAVKSYGGSQYNGAKFIEKKG